MDGTTRLKVVDLNKNLTCILCKGYLVDATTIIECLHSFCRTCIVTYLKANKSCPTCDTVVHKTRPHQNIRSDKLLQDLVYKLVPGLYKDEMRRRREFYTAHYEDAPKRPGEERGDEMCDRFIFTSDEQISLAVHLCPHGGEEANSKLQVFKTREEYKSRLEKKTKESIDVRYLQCKAAVTVGLLKKFLRLKYDLPPHYQIEMFNNDDFLRDTSSLADVAYSCCWRRKSPLRLSFSIYENSTRTIKWGEAIPKLTHSSCLKWRPVTATSAPTTTSVPVPEPSKPQVLPEAEAVSCTTPVPKSNEPPSLDLDKQPKISTEIKEEVKSPPPNGLVAQKTKSNSSLSKTLPYIDKKPKPVNKGTNKKSLLGKRPAKSPIRIAPAPSKDTPILKMPKMIKLEPNSQNGISSSVQVACPSPSFTPVSSPSASLPLFPLVSSSFLPAHMRAGQTTPFVKAFPAGLVAIPTVTSKPANLCSFAPNPVPASAPANVRRTPTNTSTNHSQPRSISKALSSLSLSSPPLPKTTPMTQGLFFSQSVSSTSSATLSFSVKSTSASAAMSTTIPTTSIASPTPAASASPTPAAIPSQQSQTQCPEASTVFSQHPSLSQTALTCANPPAVSTHTFTYISSPLNHNKVLANTQTKLPQPAPKVLSCPNGYVRSNSKPQASSDTSPMNLHPKTMSSQIPKTVSSHVPKTMSSQVPKTMSSQVPKSVSSHLTKIHTPVPLESTVTPSVTTPTTTPNTNGHSPLQTPPSSGGGASSQKKLTKPKKIADIANKLHKRVSQTVDAQNTPKRSHSPATKKQQQQPMEFTALKPNHQDSKLFNVNGQNSPMTPLGVTLKQTQPLTSSLFDPKSMHTNLINGRLEEPLNLVTRDKDFRLAPGLTRSELPPVVK